MTRNRSDNVRTEMLKLVSGTIFAQIVALLATPVITRLYSPEAYGVGIAFSSIVAVLLVFVSLRYEQAIVLPADDNQAANVFGLSLVAMLAVSGLFAGIFWLWGDRLMHWMRMPELIPYLWMIGPGLLVAGLLAVLTAWNVRTRSFGTISSGGMLTALSSTGFRVLAGLAGYGTSGAMIGANIAGSLLAVGYQGTRTLRRAGALFRQGIRPSGMKHVAVRYVELPIFGTWAALLQTIAYQLPVFLLASFFSPAVVGQYALGNRIVKLPLSLVGDSIAKVFTPRASASVHSGGLATLVSSTYRRLVALGLPPTVFLLLSGRDLFSMVFGAEWAEAGVYMQVLSVWAFARFVGAPLANLVVVLERQRFYFLWNVLSFGTQFAALWIGGRRESPLLALGLFGLAGTISYGYITAYVMHASGVPVLRVAAILSFQTLTIAPILAVIMLLKLFDVPLCIEIGLPSLMVVGYLLYTFRSELQLAKYLHVFRQALQKDKLA